MIQFDCLALIFQADFLDASFPGVSFVRLGMLVRSIGFCVRLKATSKIKGSIDNSMEMI